MKKTNKKKVKEKRKRSKCSGNKTKCNKNKIFSKTEEVNVKESLPFLNLYSKTSNEEEREYLMRNATKNNVNLLCDCVYNSFFNPDILTNEEKEILREKIKENKTDLLTLLFVKKNLPCKKRLCCTFAHNILDLIKPVLPLLEKSVNENENV